MVRLPGYYFLFKTLVDSTFSPYWSNAIFAVIYAMYDNSHRLPSHPVAYAKSLLYAPPPPIHVKNLFRSDGLC